MQIFRSLESTQQLETFECFMRLKFFCSLRALWQINIKLAVRFPHDLRESKGYNILVHQVMHLMYRIYFGALYSLCVVEIIIG